MLIREEVLNIKEVLNSKEILGDSSEIAWGSYDADFLEFWMGLKIVLNSLRNILRNKFN